MSDLFVKFNPEINGESAPNSAEATAYGDELFVASESGDVEEAAVINRNGQLVVSNIGSSGEDGVRSSVYDDEHMSQMASADTNDVVHEQRGTWVEPMIFDSATPTGNTTPDAMDDFML